MRVTNDKSCGFLDVTYLDLVDLDENPNNKLVQECFPDRKFTNVCPHHIVTNVARIIKTKQLNNVIQV